jgi:TolB-like protein
VWFDQDELRGGEAWDRKLRGQIKECALFVPVVSANTQERREGYFRLEWKLASERTHLMAEGVPFIAPVVIDETKEANALVPAEFMRVQWTRLPGAKVTPEFAEQVKRLLAPAEVARVSRPVSVAKTNTGQETRATPNRSVPMWAWATLALCVVGIGAAFLLNRKRESPVALPKPVAEKKAEPALPVINDKSVAILPFANLSPDKENEFFADGIHADLLTNLLGLRELRVTSAQTVSGYRETKKKAPEIARELGVAYILTGSVRRANDTVRVSAQLIDARTDAPIWSPAPYDKKLTDIFAIQSEIAQAIAVALKAVLSPEEKKQLERRPTENLAAYDLYLKGLDYSGSGRKSYEHTESHMQAAVNLDPNFVEAWGWLLRAQTFIYRNYEQSEEYRKKTKATYDTLMRLAPDSTATILPFARYYFWVLADFDRAIEQAERFIRLLPNDPEGYFLLEVIQFRQGKLPEAVANLRKSIALDPTFVGYRYNLIGALNGCRRYEEMIQEYQSILKYHPDSPTAPRDRAITIFRSRGSTREADDYFAGLTVDQLNSPEGIGRRLDWAEMKGDLAEFLRLHALLPDVTGVSRGLRLAIVKAAMGHVAGAKASLAPFAAKARKRAEDRKTDQAAWRLAGEVAAFLGNREEAMECVRRLNELPNLRLNAVQTAAENTTNLAAIYTWLGDKARAIEEYEKLFRMPFGNLSVHEMKRHPRYAPLRGDPRFEALLNDPKNNAPLF